jgi:hypothetical protein
VSESDRKCSFCWKLEGNAQRLPGGPAAFICNEIFADWDEGRAVASDLVCSFCGMDHRHRLVAGPVVYICDECVQRLGSN